MNKIINSEMIIMARESRGVTQSNVAKNLGVTQAAISKIEKGLSTISTDLLERISEYLQYPVSFFYEKGHRYPPSTPFHRKRKALPKKIQYQIEALANIRTIHIAKLLDSVEFVENKIIYLDLDEYNGDASTIARAVRSYLKLPRGPIKNLTKNLEDIGILIVQCDFSTQLIDGFTLISEKNHPIIFVSKNIPGDRLRFTLAHEFGHIVMHNIHHPKIEEEANSFASELLMPEEEIRPSLSHITLRKLATLKPYWRVSMGALLQRAYNLRKISYNQHRYLWTQMSKYGYTKREPIQLDIPQEKPTLLQEILEIHFTDLEFTAKELCKLLSVHLSDFLAFYPYTDRKQILHVVK